MCSDFAASTLCESQTQRNQGQNDPRNVVNGPNRQSHCVHFAECKRNATANSPSLCNACARFIAQTHVLVIVGFPKKTRKFSSARSETGYRIRLLRFSHSGIVVFVRHPELRALRRIPQELGLIWKPFSRRGSLRNESRVHSRSRRSRCVVYCSSSAEFAKCSRQTFLEALCVPFFPVAY